MAFLNEWFDTVQDVLLSPNDFFEDMPTEGGYKAPLKFAAINLLIGGFLGGAVGAAGINVLENGQAATAQLPAMAQPFAAAIAGLIGGIIGLFIGGAIFWVAERIVGGGGNYEGTVRVLSYTTATSLLSWIPVVNFFVGLYALYLNTVGFANVHNISKARAFGGILLPIIAVFLIIIAGMVLVGGTALGLSAITGG